MKRKLCYGLLLLTASCGPPSKVREVELQLVFPHALEVVPRRLERLAARGARLVVEASSGQQKTEYAFRFSPTVRLRLAGVSVGAQLTLAVWDTPRADFSGPCLVGKKTLASHPVEQVLMQLKVPASLLD
ncbi:MAG: hypothetical protein R3B54_12435 [Bdellovibrionota bacterium]